MVVPSGPFEKGSVDPIMSEKSEKSKKSEKSEKSERWEKLEKFEKSGTSEKGGVRGRLKTSGVRCPETVGQICLPLSLVRPSLAPSPPRSAPRSRSYHFFNSGETLMRITKLNRDLKFLLICIYTYKYTHMRGNLKSLFNFVIRMRVSPELKK